MQVFIIFSKIEDLKPVLKQKGLFQFLSINLHLKVEIWEKTQGLRYLKCIL